MKKLIMLALTGLLICSCSTVKTLPATGSEIMIIPEPVSIIKTGGTFMLKGQKLHIDRSSDAAVNKIEDMFSDYVADQANIDCGQFKSTGSIKFELTDSPEQDLGTEGYRLKISPKTISVKANEPAGLFYAVQTLRQLFPVNAGDKVSIPCAVITDFPRFQWRGTMLDVSRHFFPKEGVKKLIDNLAMHKINTFHWHLVDDQGWRIEIKKYPELTDIGAWRVDREQFHWNSREPQKPGEKPTYGGFYTQKEVKEIIAYAAERHITIVPEIELPAHVTAALAAYPQYSCTGGPFTVLPGGVWPITDIYCAGNDETFEFLQNVLAEVIDLFPGTFIHIGGDEATKVEWEKCPKCQTRIKEEGLKDEKELQSYFVKRIEKFISSKGKKMIGWDEILEGGLAPGAAVMSWRGFEGGIEAAQSGHDVVMTPTSHCYFDYYQGNPDNEPLAIGGYLPLSKVYKFDPVPEDLTPEQAKHILGGQCNLWTEYIPNINHLQYMLNPRLAALSEVVWSPHQKRNFEHFGTKLEAILPYYENQKINFAKSAFQVQTDTEFDIVSKTFNVKLSTEIPVPEIRYTLNGEKPTGQSSLYEKPLALEQSAEVKAAAFSNGKTLGPASSKLCTIHKATGASYTLATPVSKQYSGGSPIALTNSLMGSTNHSDGNWVGFNGGDLDAVLEFETPQTISSVSVGFLHDTGAWIFTPQYFTVSVSKDGENFKEISKIENTYEQKSSEKKVVKLDANFSEVKTQYLEITAKNFGPAPDWHVGTGDKTWLFIDEIIVE